MNCECHGLPSYWQKDARYATGGNWRCAVSKREHSRRIDAARRDIKTARQRAEYRADGWRRKRRRELARQRAQITERLQQLEQEATACL